MNGFANNTPDSTAATSAASSITPVSDISPAELDRMVARAKAERSAYFVAWLKRTARIWASIIPGRRSILPKDFSRWQTLPR